MEIWKDVVGYEGFYQVSNLGNVKSIERIVWNKANKSYSKLRGVLLKKDNMNNHYFQVRLSKDGKSKHKLVHRLVAITFLNKKEGLNLINHKDENKLNNRVENLEWCNHSYNINYGERNNKVAKSNSISVIRICNNGDIIKYKSALDAEKYGFSKFGISQCCNNRIKKHRGYSWEFEFKKVKKPTKQGNSHEMS